MPNLGDIFPNFEANTTDGPMKWHDYVGDGWAILFSHPADYTPVCTTELASVADLVPEFTKRNVKLAALSCDTVEDHLGWIKDIQCYRKHDENEPLPFPIIDDADRKLAVLLGMLDPDERNKDGLPLSARAVFVVGPDKKLKLSILYPATTGRVFSEVLRVVDSLQLTAYKKVATPANWQAGDKCMVIPSVKQEDTGKLFPKGVKVFEMPSGKEYMRFTPQPE